MIHACVWHVTSSSAANRGLLNNTDVQKPVKHDARTVPAFMEDSPATMAAYLHAV